MPYGRLGCCYFNHSRPSRSVLVACSRTFVGKGSSMTRFKTSRLVAVALFLSAMASGLVPKAMGQANVTGQWQTLSNVMPINPVHVALMRNGKVLVVSGSGNVALNTNFQAGVFDPATGTTTTQPITWDMFCNGMVVLPDGRVFINSGTLQYDPFKGHLKSAAYDLATGQFV